MVPIRLEETIRIPGNIDNLEAFRTWARSNAFPDHGWFSYLAGEIWADTSMEQFFTHNQVKTTIVVVVGGLVMVDKRGYFFSDRMLLSNPEADFATEPDGGYVSYQSIERGRVQLQKGKQGGYVELVGSPDMILEVVSDKSVQKDTKRLRKLYWQAKIPEYWLVDARGDQPRFDILRWASKGYLSTRPDAGWLKSKVFERSFRLTQESDTLGHPHYVLSVQA
jgi:Uma2 family endonuclease